MVDPGILPTWKFIVQASIMCIVMEACELTHSSLRLQLGAGGVPHEHTHQQAEVRRPLSCRPAGPHPEVVVGCASAAHTPTFSGPGPGRDFKTHVHQRTCPRPALASRRSGRPLRGQWGPAVFLPERAGRKQGPDIARMRLIMTIVQSFSFMAGLSRCSCQVGGVRSSSFRVHAHGAWLSM